MLRLLVAARYDTYAALPDRWAPAAERLATMVRAGEFSLDAMQGRMLRYCAAGDHEMAGLVLGEWIGLLLGLEHGGVREGD